MSDLEQQARPSSDNKLWKEKWKENKKAHSKHERVEDEARKEKKKKRRKRKRFEEPSESVVHDGDNDNNDIDHNQLGRDADKEQRTRKKKEKKEKKHKTLKSDGDDDHMLEQRKQDGASEKKTQQSNLKRYFPFEYQHIVAPMVGASELAFRLLCRKYGATLAYTPMMSSTQFVHEASALDKSDPNQTIANSNICEFQTIPQDRPLVAHFSANNPQHFAQAAKLVEPVCDAIDLNLGCPQRTAYLGHFGSYLLGDEDRQLVLDIVKAGSQSVTIPIFVKIRLLDTVEETIKLCHQLRDAGASLIAIHGRYRASWERTGPGARDGPAMLDQIALVKKSMPDFPIISNGNVITYDDVVGNQQFTGADGIMSAEGILNNPALYLPRLGDAINDADKEVVLPTLSPLNKRTTVGYTPGKQDKVLRKLNKKLREIENIEAKVKESGENSINEDQSIKLSAKSKILAEIMEVERSDLDHNRKKSTEQTESSVATYYSTKVKLSQLYKNANNKLALAKEYLSLVRRYPMKIRSVVFHTRRMCKELLEKYQLMEECIASRTTDEVEVVLNKCECYIRSPETFKYDLEKEAREKEALKRKREEEGKRKAFEARMVRKAKREGLADLNHYLRIGAEIPTVDVVKRLKSYSKEECLAAWKKDHSQHCMSFHLDEGGCKRDRACAFLHVEAKDGEKFDEKDEVAG